MYERVCACGYEGPCIYVCAHVPMCVPMFGCVMENMFVVGSLTYKVKSCLVVKNFVLSNRNIEFNLYIS